MNNELYREQMVTCPYNPAHQFLRQNIQKHIHACRKNYVGVPMTACLFNSTHIVRKVDLSEHMKTCPDRKHIDDYLHQTPGAPQYQTNFENDPITEGEIWDDDDVPSYNPEEYCASNPILCRMDVEAKSKRRQHRNAERKRFNELDNVKPLEVKKPQQRQPQTSMAQFRSEPSTSRGFVSQNKPK